MIALRLAGLLVGTAFCAAASLALRRRLGLDQGSLGGLVFLLLFTAIQSLLVLAAGLSGALSAGPLTLVTGLGLGLLLFRRKGLLPAWSPPSTPSGRLFAGMAALAFSSLLLKSFVLEPCTGDALQYHLPKVAEWVQSGRFVWGLNHDPRQWFSAGFELVETWWVVFLRHDRLIELGGLQMALIAGAALVAIAERLDARPGFASVVYLFLPATLLQATSCGNDLAVAALILAGYALVAAGAPRPLQALALLMAAGVKATAVFAALGILAYAAFRERPAKLPRAQAAALGIAGLVLAGFWYVRNLAAAGHPLYPMYGSHGEFAWSPQQGGVDLESLQQTVQVFHLRLLDRFPYESLGRNATGWGWAVLPLGLPALVLALREDRRFRLLTLCFLLGAGATLACVWPDDHNLRFILWFPALFALALARQKAPLWLAAAVLACVVNFASTLVPYEIRHARHLQPPPSLAPLEPVACVFVQAVPSYRLYNPDFSRRVVYPRSMEELRRSGAKVVYLYEIPGWAAEIASWPRLAKDYHAAP